MIYVQNDLGEQFKIKVVTEDTLLLYSFLDQYNKAGFKQIKESEFNHNVELMDIDVMDESKENLICVLSTKKIDV